VSAILIIAIFVLFAASYAVIRSKRSKTTPATEDALPPREPRTLFGEGAPLDCRTGIKLAEYDLAREDARLLRERASSGDVSALHDAHALRDSALYGEALDALVAHAGDDAEQLRLVSSTVIRSDELRGSAALARKLLDAWRESPDGFSAFEVLRAAALSDDASTFERAMTEILDAHLGGRLKSPAARELRELFESEFWVLSSEARRTGAGFALKQKLAEVCRLLSGRARRDSPATEEAERTEASS